LYSLIKLETLSDNADPGRMAEPALVCAGRRGGKLHVLTVFIQINSLVFIRARFRW